MLSQFVKGKVAVFIDAANILYSQKTLKWYIDYQKLSEYLRQECAIVGVFYYTGIVGTFEKQRLFVRKLKSLKYQVTAKEVKFIRVPGRKDLPKGNLDVELALDAYRLKHTFDTLVLFSGDSDFAYLLDLLKRDAKKVVVVSMRGHVARELLERAKYISLSQLRSVIEFKEFKRPDKPASEV